MSIFTDLVLVRSPCLLGRSRPSIHRWKALVAKEKKKERKEGGREGVWVIFRHQKHGAYAVKTGAEQFMASTGAESTREKEHIGENPTSKAPLSMENEPPPRGAKRGHFGLRTGRSAYSYKVEQS